MARKQALDTLREIRSGAFLEDVTAELNDLVRAVRQTDKKGSITIKLDIDPIKGDADMVTVSDTITTKAPKPEQAPTLFYTTVEANLQLRNPAQPKLPGLSLEGGTESEVRTIDDNDGDLKQNV